MPTNFVDTSQKDIDDILTINIHATLRMTSMVLPKMIQRYAFTGRNEMGYILGLTNWRRKRGLIINMGSFAGAVPSPMLATYSASKAFLSTYTSALAEEVKAHNIVVQHVNAFYVVRVIFFGVVPRQRKSHERRRMH